MVQKAINYLKNFDKKDVLIFVYHLFFILIAYKIRVDKGISDSHLYWGKTIDISQHSWFDFANYGTNFIVFLNYPFIKLGLPFWFGFFMYGVIGFFGIKKFIDWTSLVVGKAFEYKGFNLLYLVFFLPNLHFWTASLGKEALIFWGISAVFYAIASHNYKTLSFIIGSLLVLIIRPHVALMLLSAITVAVFFNSAYSIKKRIRFSVFAVTFLLVLLYMVFQLSNIRYWNWERISYFNEYSILSFKNSGSYVPMLEYNYLNKLFALNFRPLFFDAYSFWTVIASIENLFILLLYCFALFFVLKYYRKIHFAQWMKIAFLFTFIASAIYVQRYANLGIFMRTKMMFEPFTIIALCYICKQGLTLNNIKS